MLTRSIQGVGQALSDMSAIKFFQFMSTYNVGSQGLAIDANANDIQSTGGADCMINGLLVTALTGDAAFDISGGLQGTAWVTAQSYVTHLDGGTGTMRSVDGRQYVCTVAHTSSSLNKPVSGNDWRSYWMESDSTAKNAYNTLVTSGNSCYFMVCADQAGELSIWNAGNVDADADVECIIPNYEEELFLPVGLLLVNSASDFYLGVTALTGLDTYYNFIGPVIPKQW